MANTIIIRNNGWNVHINLDGIDDEILGGIVREIAEEDFYWENFCKCDDLWFNDGGISLTCTFVNKFSKHITFQALPVMEKFCLYLTSRKGADFIQGFDTADTLDKTDLRRIVLKMIEAVENPNPGTDIWAEVKKSLLS
jgi:hypothetical protein